MGAKVLLEFERGREKLPCMFNRVGKSFPPSPIVVFPQVDMTELTCDGYFIVFIRRKFAP